MKTATEHLQNFHQPKISRRQMLVLGVSTMCSATAMADSFPQKPVQLVVPYTAGGVTDSLARIFSTKLKDAWSQPVIVDNRPGAGSTMGAAAVARSSPDGHTLLLGSVGMVTAPFMFKSMPYKPGELIPLALVASTPNVLYVHSSVPAKNIEELVEYARKKPGSLSFASAGIGSSPHLAAALFAAQAGIEVLHVPYKGTAPAFADFLGGQVNAYFDTLQSMHYVKEGRIRALAVTTEKRISQAPELPTVEESGVASGVFSSSWFGFFVPAKTPLAIQRQISQSLLAIAEDKESQQKMTALGVRPEVVDAAGFDRFLKKETAKWGGVIRDLNIQID